MKRVYQTRSKLNYEMDGVSAYSIAREMRLVVLWPRRCKDLRVDLQKICVVVKRF